MTSVAPHVSQEIEEYLEVGIFHDKGKDPDSEEFMGYIGARDCYRQGDKSQLIRCLVDDIRVKREWINHYESSVLGTPDEDVDLWTKENLELVKLERMLKSLD